jgi:hypothetical protein
VKIAFCAVAATALAGAALLTAPAAAQNRPVCRETRAEDMPNADMLLARAYDCVERGFSSSLLSAADEVEKGYKGGPPDWRRAKEAYEFIANRNQGRKVNTMAWHNWVGSLGNLSRNYETGRPGSGWPQDLALARGYQLRLVTGIEAAPDADPAHLGRARSRLTELDAKLALQRQRSGRWNGDIAALSKINRFALREPDIGAPHLTAIGFAAIITLH